MAITSYHILLLHKVNHIDNLKFDHYSIIALTIYTAYLLALPEKPNGSLVINNLKISQAVR